MSLFLWLLWGDFVFILMESVVPSIVPIKLDKVGASSTTIGLVSVTLTSVMNLIMTPIVSFKSDRYRSKWGRRIPFLIWPSPFIVAFLVLLGFSVDIGGLLHVMTGWGASKEALTIWLIAGLMVCFQFFNMFVASVYWYLFNDVVPPQFLGRFMALFRVVGLAAGGVYSFVAAPYAETHMKEIFVIAGVSYLVVFTLMCLKVKEGSYPPPPLNVDGRQGVLSSFKTFGRECFSHRLYWYFYATNTFWALSLVINAFHVFFFRSVGVNAEQFFKVMAWSSWLTIPFLLASSYFVDRFHPIRVQLIGKFGLLLLVPIQMIFLFKTFDPETSRWILLGAFLLAVPLQGIYAAAELPMYMLLLPKSRYGQFSSSNALIRALCLIVGGLLGGVFIDTMASLTDSKERAFLFVPVWTFTMQVLSASSLVMLYITWKRLGGDESYHPPGFDIDDIVIERHKPVSTH